MNFRRAVSVALLSLAAACGSKAPAAATTGTLEVTIAGLPAGGSGNIVVSGPGGISQPVTGTGLQTVTLPVGTYALDVKAVEGGDYSFAGSASAPSVTLAAAHAIPVTVTYAPATGALRLGFSGLPASATQSLVVTGPASFSQILTLNGVVPRLAPGVYNVAATGRSGAIVSTVFTAAGTATVSAGATAAIEPPFVQRPGTGKLWLALDNKVAGYDAAQLAASGSPAPAVEIGIASQHIESVTFDALGNLTEGAAAGYLLRYATSQLAASTTAPPAVVISRTAPLTAATWAGHDAADNLWVVNRDPAILKFCPGAVRISGSPDPDVTLHSPSLSSPVGATFDAAGNLWVANFGNNTLVKFTAAQLASSGTVTAAVVVAGPSLASPVELAFDADGNLWVSNFASNTVVAFRPADLVASSGLVSAAVVLSPTGAGSLSNPRGLAFDNAGDLWVRSATTLVKFSKSQLAASGAPAPVVTVGGIGATDAGGIRFSPPPGNLPVYR